MYYAVDHKVLMVHYYIPVSGPTVGFTYGRWPVSDCRISDSVTIAAPQLTRVAPTSRTMRFFSPHHAVQQNTAASGVFIARDHNLNLNAVYVLWPTVSMLLSESPSGRSDVRHHIGRSYLQGHVANVTAWLFCFRQL